MPSLFIRRCRRHSRKDRDGPKQLLQMGKRMAAKIMPELQN
jgi:hypothetical protein